MTFSIFVLLHICGFIFQYYNQAITIVLPYSLPTYKLVSSALIALVHFDYSVDRFQVDIVV